MLTVATATVGKIPKFGKLFASEAVIFNQIFTQTSVDVPSPAPAATRTFLIRVKHRVVVCRLFFRRQDEVVVADEFLGESYFDIVWIVRNGIDILPWQ